MVGASLIANLLATLGQRVEEGASLNFYKALKQREYYEQKISIDNPLCIRLYAFMNYNAAYLITVMLWIIWLAFITVWSIIATSNFSHPEHKWGFAYAQYFAVSLCSSAGSFSLPSDSPNWSYALAAVSMMIGVPLMALAISSIVIMLWQGQKFKLVKNATWTPITLNELEALKQLGISSSDELISKGDYILLGLLRMGHDGGVIKYLSEVYDASVEERGGVPMDERVAGHGRAFSCYSAQAQAYVVPDEPEGKSDQLICTDTSAESSSGVVADAEVVEPDSQSLKDVDRKRQWSTLATAGEQSPRNSGNLDHFFGMPTQNNSLHVGDAMGMETIQDPLLTINECHVKNESGNA